MAGKVTPLELVPRYAPFAGGSALAAIPMDVTAYRIATVDPSGNLTILPPGRRSRRRARFRRRPRPGTSC
jgi:hypothetical protein